MTESTSTPEHVACERMGPAGIPTFLEKMDEMRMLLEDPPADRGVPVDRFTALEAFHNMDAMVLSRLRYERLPNSPLLPALLLPPTPPCRTTDLQGSRDETFVDITNHPLRDILWVVMHDTRKECHARQVAWQLLRGYYRRRVEDFPDLGVSKKEEDLFHVRAVRQFLTDHNLKGPLF